MHIRRWRKYTTGIPAVPISVFAVLRRWGEATRIASCEGGGVVSNAPMGHSGAGGNAFLLPHHLGIGQGRKRRDMDPVERELGSSNDCSCVRKMCIMLLYRVLWRLVVFSPLVGVFLENDQPEAGVIEEITFRTRNAVLYML